MRSIFFQIIQIDDNSNHSYCHTRLHLGFSAKLKIWQVPSCKMEPRSTSGHPPSKPYGYCTMFCDVSPPQLFLLRSASKCVFIIRISGLGNFYEDKETKQTKLCLIFFGNLTLVSLSKSTNCGRFFSSFLSWSWLQVEPDSPSEKLLFSQQQR